MIFSLTAYGQSSNEKLEVDRQEYKRLLIKCNEVVDLLELRRNEAKLLKHRDSLNVAELDGLTYQIENQKEYITHLKKGKRKAWFNGLWQGGIIGGTVVGLLILL